MILSSRNSNNTILTPNATLSKEVISLEWIFEGDRIQDHIVQTLLDKALDTFGSKHGSDPVDWEHTFIQVPGHAGFDIEPENGANFEMSWRDAVNVVHGVEKMMAIEGYFERSATVLLAGRIRIARLAIFLEGLEEKTKGTQNVTDSANLIASTNVTNITTFSSPEPNDQSIYLGSIRPGKTIENSDVVRDMLADAVSVALAYVADGLGDLRVNWRDSHWKAHGISMSIYTKREAIHKLNWRRTLQALVQAQKLVQSSFGYTEFRADILWKVGEEEEAIGDMQLKIIDTTTIVMSEKPITLALGNLTPLGSREDIIYLRYTYRGEYIPALSVLAVFRGAIGAALDELDVGKSRDPVDWKELKYFGLRVDLVVKALQEVSHRMTWSMLVQAEEMMLKHLGRNGYRELNADIVRKGHASLDHGEVIGTMKLMGDSALEGDAAPTIDTA